LEYKQLDDISKADVILLVYDVTRPETIDRLKQYWIPIINQKSRSPIILVGNKADLSQIDINNSFSQYESIINPLVIQY